MDRRTQFMFARKATTRKLIKGFINKMLLLCERVVYILRGFESGHVYLCDLPHTRIRWWLNVSRPSPKPTTNLSIIINKSIFGGFSPTTRHTQWERKALETETFICLWPSPSVVVVAQLSLFVAVALVGYILSRSINGLHIYISTWINQGTKASAMDEFSSILFF